MTKSSFYYDATDLETFTAIGEAYTQTLAARDTAVAAAASVGSAAADAATATAQASVATTKAGEAASSAGQAATSAGQAATYASQAQASATSASASAASAGNSATSASNAYNGFASLWCGTSASDPTTNLIGGALVAGNLYFNTSSGLRIYNGSSWNAYSPATGGGVTSIYGRSGIVTAQPGDYTWTQIGSKPTTLSGFGITDAVGKTDTANTWSLTQTFAVAPVFTAQSATRAALGLGGAATLNVGATAGTVAAGDDSRFGNAVGAAQKASNLADLADAVAARANLGLGTAATQTIGTSGANVPLMSTQNTWSQQQVYTEATLTDAVNVAWNLQTQPVASWSVGGARVLNAPTNQVAGAIYSLQLINSTGSASVAFTSSAYKGVSGYSLTAGSGKVDELTFRSNGSVLRLIGVRQDIGG